eukprot:gene11632-biopygen1846
MESVGGGGTDLAASWRENCSQTHSLTDRGQAGPADPPSHAGNSHPAVSFKGQGFTPHQVSRRRAAAALGACVGQPPAVQYHRQVCCVVWKRILF